MMPIFLFLIPIDLLGNKRYNSYYNNRKRKEIKNEHDIFR